MNLSSLPKNRNANFVHENPGIVKKKKNLGARKSGHQARQTISQCVLLHPEVRALLRSYTCCLEARSQTPAFAIYNGCVYRELPAGAHRSKVCRRIVHNLYWTNTGYGPSDGIVAPICPSWEFSVNTPGVIRECRHLGTSLQTIRIGTKK